MTQLDKALHELTLNYSQKSEIQFETALRESHIFIIEDFTITTEDDHVIIPIFSNDEYAMAMGVSNRPIYTKSLRDVSLRDNQELVLNPMHEAIVLDSEMLALIFDENPEITINPADNSALSVIFALKERLESYPEISTARLGILQTGRRREFVIIIDGVEDETTLRSTADALFKSLNTPLPLDLYPLNSELGRAVAKITKPFYTK